MRAVQFQHVEASLDGPAVQRGPRKHQSFTSPRSSAFGTGHRSLWAIALGATGDQASQSSISGVRCSGPSPSHGRVARALRPEWPSVNAGDRILLPDEFGGAGRVRPFFDEAVVPDATRSPTVPQPRRSTLVEFDERASPAPSRRPNFPAFIKCQSVGKPFNGRILMHTAAPRSCCANRTPRIVIGKTSRVPDMFCFLKPPDIMNPAPLSADVFLFYCLAALSVLAFGLACVVL